MANNKAAQQLGMAWGTASYRLRKLVFHDLVRRLGLDTCFRCGKKIETADDLSLDHKQVWLDVDPRLFWSLENIAFSHRRCNLPARYRGGVGLRKVGPPGTAWCSRCQAFLPMDSFPRHARSWSGVRNYCRSCRYTKHKAYRADKTEGLREPGT